MAALSPGRLAVAAQLVASLLLGAAGCTLDAYPCDSNGNCIRNGESGRCMPGGGAYYCAFVAGDCPSRLRWDDSAEASLAGQCVAPTRDQGVTATPDLLEEEKPDLGAIGECDPGDPLCEHATVTSPFPLQRDPNANPAETDVNLDRNGEGALIVGKSVAASPFAWITDSGGQFQVYTVSKYDLRTMREVGRYPAVSCTSLKTGSTAACDGTNGCCSNDDMGRFRARKANSAEPPHQAVQQQFTSPSITAVDFNGDGFVENQGFGGQSALTKIAGSMAGCVDRNRNGRIDTSNDANGDGVINADCNNDMAADDLASVQKKPCDNGLKQEYFGRDDECLLWTTNVGDANKFARAMALDGSGPAPGGSDAWVVFSDSGMVLRIDGASGQIREEGAISNQCRANAIVVDSTGIAWTAPQFQGSICYFDTRQLNQTGSLRSPTWGQLSVSSISLDRDQNIWVGGNQTSALVRYAPVRDKGFAMLGSGRFVQVKDPGKQGGAQNFGQGVIADNRSQATWFVWLADQSGRVVRVPGWNIDRMIPAMGDQMVDGAAYPVFQTKGLPIGVTLDADQNVVGIASSPTTLTRAKVDSAGAITPPVLNGMPMGNGVCPAGDVCSQPSNFAFTDTDGDMTGFTLRAFGRGRGTYTWVFSGCKDGSGLPVKTTWYKLAWDAMVPDGTTLTARARTGPTPTPDALWSGKTPPSGTSPVDFTSLTVPADKFLQVELQLTPSRAGATPSVKSFTVDYRCP